MGVLGVAVLAAALNLRGRRSPTIIVPDTVPDDLVERDRVGL